jgi:hypothetical protein
MKNSYKILSAVLTFMLSVSVSFAAWDSTKTTGDPLLSADWNSMVMNIKGWVRADETDTSDIYLGTTGNVGIGTETPAGTLDVNGDICLSGDCKSSWAAILGGAKFIDGDTSSDAVFTGGNLGVGTADPTNLLTVRGDVIGDNVSIHTVGKNSINFLGSAQNQLHLQQENSGPNILSGISFGADINDNTKAVAGIAAKIDADNSQLLFGTSNSSAAGVTNTAMVIDKDGNIGIGTVTPTSKFHVEGATKLNGVLTVGGSQAARIETNSSISYFGSDSAAIPLRFVTNITANLANEKGLSILDNGNVGIGTTTPTSTLDVIGEVKGTTISVNGEQLAVNNGNLYYNEGNFGIGTTDPTSKLHVNGDSTLVLPSGSWSGLGSIDAQENRRVILQFTEATKTDISTISLTADKFWKVVFKGLWGNNYEGGGLEQPAGYIEATSENPTITIGRIVLNISRNATTGKLEASTTSTVASKDIGFSGSIDIISNNVGVAGSNAMELKGDLKIIGSGQKRLNIDSSDDNAVLSLNSQGEQWALKSTTDGAFILRDDDAIATRLTVDTSGNVGIGVTPESWDTIAPVLRIGITTAIASYDGQKNTLIMNNSYYQDGYKRIIADEATRYNAVDGTHQFDVAANDAIDSEISWTTAMLIANNGNVGIGTETPATNLHIKGDGVAETLRVESQHSSDSTIRFDSAYNIGGNSVYSTITNSAGQLIFNTDVDDLEVNSDILFKTDNTIKATLKASGDLGIGTETPAGLLDVNGDICIAGDCITAWADISGGGGGGLIEKDVNNDVNLIAESGAKALTVDSATDYVGIGTTAPTGLLDVNGDICIFGDCITAWDDVVSGRKFVDGVTTTDAVFTGGKVGIGTTEPASTLHIADTAGVMTLESTSDGNSASLFFREAGTDKFRMYLDAGIDAFKIDDQDAAETRLTITNEGNVGMGTTAPSATLHVSGGSEGSSSLLEVEDFESGSLASFTNVVGDNGDWAITSSPPVEFTPSFPEFNTSIVMMSGLIDNEFADLEYDVVIPAGGAQISFEHIESSESVDVLEFYIDDVLTDSWGGVNEIWSFNGYALTEGAHTVRWRYSKDESVSEGLDSVALDNIQILQVEPDVPAVQVTGGPMFIENGIVLRDVLDNTVCYLFNVISGDMGVSETPCPEDSPS